MGVGRSGTTAIYALLQQILEDYYPDDVDYVYEPFHWDRQTFNQKFGDVTEEFTYAASISVEGIYHHKKMPILLGSEPIIEKGTTEWLERTLTPSNEKTHYLGKMIRASGRVSLIRKLAPKCKIIFITRNPVDVLNSSKQMFSFYGNEFYESDLERFSKDVKTVFGTDGQSGSSVSADFEAEYAYWYYSNLAFLLYSEKVPANIFTMAYEAYVENPDHVIQQVCDFIGVECKPEFNTFSRIKVGQIKSANSSLTQREYLFVQSKLPEYLHLLEKVKLKTSTSVSKNVNTAQIVAGSPVTVSPPHLNSIHATRLLRLCEIQKEALKKKHSELISS